MASHREVAEPKRGRTEGVEVRLEVWTELLLEVLGMEGTEVQREAEVPLTQASKNKTAEDLANFFWVHILYQPVWEQHNRSWEVCCVASF